MSELGDWGSGNYPIQPCPKCKKAQGYNWTWGKNDGHSKGFSTCKACGAKFWKYINIDVLRFYVYQNIKTGQTNCF